MTDLPWLQPTMTLPSPALTKLFSQVLAGEMPISELVDAIQSVRTDSQSNPICTSPPQRQAGNTLGLDHFSKASLASESVTPNANIDLGRKSRCGFGEVIYGDGKPADLISKIVKSQLDFGQNVLVTRLNQTSATILTDEFPHSFYNPEASTLRVASQSCGQVTPIPSSAAGNTVHAAVVTAGSTDRFVAEEISETLEWMGIPQTRFEDIGVAGPQRLLAVLPELRKASVVVVAAGMEGALPAVIGGYLSVPIFAVPTSVGYGANFGGLSALLSMLNTCASSVAVVNIDSGFKGGYLAGLVANQLIEMQKRIFAEK